MEVICLNESAARLFPVFGFSNKNAFTNCASLIALRPCIVSLRETNFSRYSSLFYVQYRWLR